VAGANVSGQVANAASADVALSVAGANVSGTVSLATTANVANSVSRGNVSGAGNIGQLQFADAAGNLTSNDRYYIGANATGGINASRDTTGAQMAAISYHNTAISTSYSTGRARGTKAAPLPVQVGDRIGSLFACAYTGNATGVLDGVTGFVTNNTPGISILVTSLPTGNGNVPGTSTALVSSNSAGNTSFSATLREDGVFTTPKLRVSNPVAPASATATGTAGDITWDSNFVYVCVATDTWKRSALTTW
jgi:hypothetical protein